MPVLETTAIATATLIGGSAGTGFFSWLRARRRAPMEDMKGVVDVAKGINDMALRTLERVTTELDSVTARLDKVEAAQEESVAELNRVTALFREALAVLRVVIDAVQVGRIPQLEMSSELRREVEQSTSA